MKKLLFLVVALILSLAACAPAPTLTVTTLPPETASPSASQIVLQTNLPSVLPSTSALTEPLPTVTASASPQASKEVSSPVIIASDVTIIGGYSGGKWIPHVSAAALCQKKKTFYAYNLTGLLDAVKSKGLADDSGESCNLEDGGIDKDYRYDNTCDLVNSWSIDNKAGEGSEYVYCLDSSDYYDADYSGGTNIRDALNMAYYYNVPPESVPAVTLLSDTSALNPIIQAMIDKNLGTGVAKAHIQTAAQADIDGDGKPETIVNADNCGEIAGDDPDTNLYSIALIIEDDGTVHSVYECYSGTDDDSDFEYEYIQNVVDLDGDGKCEIVADCTVEDVWCSYVYKYDGGKSKLVLSCEADS